MAIFAGASTGAVQKLRCPRCAEIQARARAAPNAIYRCRACHAEFRAEDARPEEPARRPRARRSEG